MFKVEHHRPTWHHAVLALSLLGVCSVLPSTGHQCNIVVYFGQKTAECKALGLTELPDDFDYDVKVLHFRKNNLVHIGIDFFKKYTALQEIFLEENKIDTIAPEGFRGLSNLQVLDMQGNALTTVPIASFRYLTSLRELVLRGNPMKYITENAFGNLPRIEVLNFENCILERVDPKAFHGLTNVKEINLVNNELNSLGAPMEHSLPPNLSIFRLYRNPWNCNCKLRWLRQWIANTRVNWDFSQNTPACSTPEILLGLNWKHLKPEQFACPSRILANGTTSIELEVGQNVTTDCLVSGDPIPLVTWFKGTEPIHALKNMEKYMILTRGLDPIRSSLTVWDIDQKDAGDYKCVADNSVGRSEVTYKLWIRTEGEMPSPRSVTGISQESILGIAVGGALFILILVVCVVYGLRRRDRRKHAYRVRDYKKTQKGKKDKSYIKENCEKSLPCATTELLSEKEKEKERERGKMELAKSEKPIGNDIRHEKEEFKMKIFAYRGPQKDDKTKIDHGYATPDREDTETDPLCKNTDSLKPVCNNVREVTPDLLKNEHNKVPAKKQNISTKEESPCVKGDYTPATPNGGLDKGVHVTVRGPVKDAYHKISVPKETLSESVVDKHKDHSSDRHPSSRKGSLDDLLTHNSSSSRDSLSSSHRASSKGSPSRSPNTEQQDNILNQSQCSSTPHGVSNSHSLSSNMSRSADHKQPGSRDRDRHSVSDCGKYSTLPSKSGAKNLPAASYMPSGTIRPNHSSRQHSGVGSPGRTVPKAGGPVPHRPHPQGWGHTGSPHSSPGHKQGARAAAAAATVVVPVPIIKLPDGHLSNKKDYRALVVPPPPLPPANRSPFAIKSTPGPAALVNPGEGIPAPRKPPRTYSSVYENPYSAVPSRQNSRQSSRQSSHDSEVEKMPNVGEKDEFGTCV